MLTNHKIPPQQWLTSILNYQGDPSFPAFETYCNELIPPQDPILCPVLIHVLTDQAYDPKLL